jgi:hypothetical protein
MVSLVVSRPDHRCWHDERRRGVRSRVVEVDYKDLVPSHATDGTDAVAASDVARG